MVTPKGHTAEEVLAFIKTSIMKHCKELPNCAEDICQSDNFLIEAHQVLADICEEYEIYAEPNPLDDELYQREDDE